MQSAPTGPAQRSASWDGGRVIHARPNSHSGRPEVAMRNTAIALSALFVTVQILLLSTSPTAAISVDLAKKCRDMAIKAHPPAMPGKPYAQAERLLSSLRRKERPDRIHRRTKRTLRAQADSAHGGCADVNAAPHGNPQHGPRGTNPHPHLQGGKHVRGLEAGSDRQVCAAQRISDL